jgi:hypothetical protein
MQKNPRLDVANYGLDDEDVRDWFANIERHVSEGRASFFKSRPTERSFPGTMSDSYRAYVPDIGNAYIKFVIYRDCLIVTSFKEDADVV